jgi:hypothetical protein
MPRLQFALLRRGARPLEAALTRDTDAFPGTAAVHIDHAEVLEHKPNADRI